MLRFRLRESTLLIAHSTIVSYWRLKRAWVIVRSNMTRHLTLQALTEQIPEHLKPFVATQDPSLYTAIDHASWRYILRVSKAFFAKNAHRKYIDGLKDTGISSERIPLISEMDACLKRFGWRAVAVSGFIPPAAFMEFQSLGVLPIACDMRTIEHLSYTPAPDIVHEAAGHAPIIADPEYATYLRNYGDVSRKAIFSDHDMRVYEAIRSLSEIKEHPASTPAEIQAAQDRLDRASENVNFVSEAAYLARMNWWTVEYGLIGSLNDPKIYGAGLLSSVGESYHCLSPKVRKIPFDLGCIQVPYDITRPQPQLFVTPDFAKLTTVLEEFAETMSFRIGGTEALKKGKAAGTPTTAVLDSGIQIGGKLVDIEIDGRGRVAYLHYQGPTQLGYEDLELPDQGAAHHREGYSTPVGKVVGGGPAKFMHKSPSELSPADLESLGFKTGSMGQLTFESGVTLTGSLKGIVSRNHRNVLLTFEKCTVKLGEKTLFQPEWGVFDMACGTQVVSVFGGAPDRVKYLLATADHRQSPGLAKSNLTPRNRELVGLYAEVRKIREAGKASPEAARSLTQVQEGLDRLYPDDWLLRLELLEVSNTLKLKSSWESKIRSDLTRIGKTSPDLAEVIARGLELI